MKFLVEQMLDQLRKHGAARVHPRIVAAPAAAKLPFPERIPNGVTTPAFSFFKHFFAVRHSVNWHYNANDSKPKKGDSNYTFVPPQAEDETRPSWAFSLCLVAPALLVMLFGCGGGSSSTAVNPPPGGPPALALSAFVSGLASPVGMEVPNDGTGRLFVLEQGGRIRIIQNGALVATPFLDITSKVESGGEKGLLGLAFHPSFSSNRRFFLYYTRRLSLQLQSVFSEYAASSSNPDQADASSEHVLLVVNQPFDNHNGGQLAFGPDGFLYIGLGDGGSEGDPQGNGQNLQTLLGKILRIDVDGAFAPGKQYAIPADNPFTPPSGLPEIWAYGLRNPWRFSC